MDGIAPIDGLPANLPAAVLLEAGTQLPSDLSAVIHDEDGKRQFCPFEPLEAAAGAKYSSADGGEEGRLETTLLAFSHK